MKIKPVVASLIVLGLATPVFAHNAKAASAQQAIVDQNSLVSSVCSESWFNHISLGGKGSVVGIIGNTNLPGSFTKLNSGSSLYINDANLLVNAALGQWSKFNLNLGYRGAPNKFSMTGDTTAVKYQGSHKVFIEEAYVTIADFAKYPVYLKIGKAYIPFGEYNDQSVPWQIASPAQMLSQMNAPTAILGVASDFGFYASVFALKGMTAPVNSNTNNIRNWGAKIGYKDSLARFQSPNTNYNVNLSYIRSIWDSQFFTPDVNSPYDFGSSSGLPSRDYIGGLSAHLDLSHKQFSMYADFVSATKDMASAYYANGSTTAASYASSSKFWGANVNAAYAFETLAHDSSFGIGAQFSGNGQWFADSSILNNDSNGGMFKYLIPKWRALAEYKVNLCKHTDLGFIFAHSASYDFTTSGDSRISNVGMMRLGVRF